MRADVYLGFVSKLFTPIALRGLTLENRIVVSPMCQYSSTDGNANDWHVVNLGHFALSGPGLVFFEATHVSPEGRITDRDLGLYSGDNEAAMARVVAFVRTWTRSKIGVQLAHAGRKGSTLPPWEGGGPAAGEHAYQTVAPSALAFGNYRTPEALDENGLQKIRDDFVAAATRAQRLGVDVIELHFAHGYLVHQFLSPLSNVRTDAYGGSLENRMRFPLELFEAVRAVWPQEKPLGVRISASDWVAGGWDLEHSIAFVRELRERGCDFVDCSSGGLSPDQKIAIGPGYQVPFSEAIRKATGIATFAVGMITEPVQAEEIIANGQADCVVLARAFIRNPNWVWDAADDLGGESFVPPEYQRGRNLRA
ncbi:MAG TPA: NADH:flavin oxidoreductase/NADH oxidase [Candidatus Acidoferrales bacterium]|nr:NADH:flavin oxidoreductase/NADH oxidase [Candidatus Acidoferrales bacterium]